MSKTPLGYRWQKEVGWTGHSGDVPIQGPVEEPCDGCGSTRRKHEPTPTCLAFHGWQSRPTPETTVEAEVITSWTCHACGHDSDVSGEGAVFSWMECTCGEHDGRGCGESSYLVLT